MNEHPFHMGPEAVLQYRATAWMTARLGYTESFGDLRATGSRIDSVGLLYGRLALMEFKTKVNCGTIEHDPQRAGSLEEKFAAVLHGVYHHSSDPASQAALRIWDRKRPPLLVVVAEHYTAGAVARLGRLFQARSAAWRFSWMILHWDGRAMHREGSGDLRELPERAEYDKVEIPVLAGSSYRRRKLTVDELRRVGEQRGAGWLIDHALRAARHWHLARGSTRSTINLKHPRYKTIMSLHVLLSSASNGLIIGYDLEHADVGPSDLPGTAIAPVGSIWPHFRSLARPDEIDAFFAAILS